MNVKKIVHVDMDAFYASVEQRDNPKLKGRPVIVGGTVQERGVVAACSYEARKFGVHSAMSTVRALALCPEAVLLRPDFKKYEEASSIIRKIFHEYTNLVEPLSLDEAYLDVTDNYMEIKSATVIAREIKKKIFAQTGLTASAGVSYCKFLAKIASGYKKPDGLTIVTPERALDFIAKLPIGDFHGVGKVTEKNMHAINIKTGADLRKKTLQELEDNFGKAGAWFYNLARGIDDSLVEPNWIRKSVGRETTFAKDSNDLAELKDILEQLCFEVETDMKREGIKGKTITLKVKYFDFKQITRSITIDKQIQAGATINKYIQELFKKTEAGIKKIRLLGVSMHGFEETKKK
ncbi:MAG: DNA polymerase IV [bacterium]